MSFFVHDSDDDENDSDQKSNVESDDDDDVNVVVSSDDEVNGTPEFTTNPRDMQMKLLKSYKFPFKNPFVNGKGRFITDIDVLKSQYNRFVALKRIALARGITDEKLKFCAGSLFVMPDIFFVSPSHIERLSSYMKSCDANMIMVELTIGILKKKRTLVSSRIAIKKIISDGIAHTKYPDGKLSVATYDIGLHSGIVLIDKKAKTIERFEPHGSDTDIYNKSHLDAIISVVFNGMFGTGFEYISPDSFSPLYGPQTISDDSMCSSWSWLYFFTRIMNPKETRNDILAYLTTQNKDALRAFLNDFIVSVSNDYLEPLLSPNTIPGSDNSIVFKNPISWQSIVSDMRNWLDEEDIKKIQYTRKEYITLNRLVHKQEIMKVKGDMIYYIDTIQYHL